MWCASEEPSIRQLMSWTFAPLDNLAKENCKYHYKPLAPKNRLLGPVQKQAHLSFNALLLFCKTLGPLLIRIRLRAHNDSKLSATSRGQPLRTHLIFKEHRLLFRWLLSDLTCAQKLQHKGCAHQILSKHATALRLRFQVFYALCYAFPCHV